MFKFVEWHKEIKSNKILEIEAYYSSFSHLIDLHLSYSTKCDHAGVSFFITLLGLTLSIEFYDTRHWNCDNNIWNNSI